jgi:hypothetical protein
MKACFCFLHKAFAIMRIADIYQELGQKDKNLHKNLNDLRDAYHPISILTIKNSD